MNKHTAHQKPMMLPIATPETVIQRFPHLREKLVTKAFEDEEFLALCDDYASLVRMLKSLEMKDSAQRDELTLLKGALELEILERLSRSN